MADLKKEKNNLNDTLEKMTKKLEDTEDTLFDSQNELKKKQKEASIMVWRILTNTERLRKRYTDGISDLDRDAKSREEKLKTTMQRKIDEAVLIALKLCATVMEVEKNRRYSPTHSLTYSLTHLLTYSPTHSLIYSLTHLLTR